MTNTILIFGLGYCGARIAQALAARGWTVRGTTRSGRAAVPAGIEVFAFDGRAPLPAAALAGLDAVLSTVPPEGVGDPVLTAMGPALAALPIRWAGYLSTTGVYGDQGGAWVDESTPCAPGQERSRRRLEAEQAWAASGLPAHLFRLAGIYGPGRSALDSVRAGTARRIVKPGQVFSRIHVDDIVQAVLASLDRPDPGAVYNLCDDDPAPPEAVIEAAAALLGQAPPPRIGWEEAQATLSPMALGFYAENKRVDNRKMKERLGVRLLYPDYRSGLAAILAAEGG